MSSKIGFAGHRAWPTIMLLLGGVLVGFVSFTIGAALPLIGRSFRADNSQLGILLGAFVGGFGIFQIPAGFGALKWGTRETYLMGLGLVGSASLLSGFSMNLFELALLRFMVGVGAALSSGTAYSLLASYYAEGEKGKSIGIYFGITNGLGGVVGLPAAVLLALAFGWAFPVQLGGALALLASLLSFFILPIDKTQKRNDLGAVWSRGRLVLRSRSVWALAIGLAGFTAGAYVPIDYITQYFNQVHPFWGISTAATIAAVGVAFTLPGGILGGRIGEKSFDRRVVLTISAAIFGVFLVMLPYLVLQLLWVWYAAAGIFVGIVSAVMNIVPAYLEESRGENLSLGIGIINSTQLLFASVFLAFFGMISIQPGFTFAWITTGAISIALLPLLLLVSRTGHQVLTEIE